MAAIKKNTNNIDACTQYYVVTKGLVVAGIAALHQ
jgi:hypothetical protein